MHQARKAAGGVIASVLEILVLLHVGQLFECILALLDKTNKQSTYMCIYKQTNKQACMHICFAPLSVVRLHLSGLRCRVFACFSSYEYL